MKTNLDSLFKTSEVHENQGVWLDITETTGFRVKPFKATNPQVKAAMAAFYKPFAYQLEHGRMDPKKEREITIKMFIHASLMDWRGVVIDGVDTPYSKEIAEKYFNHLPDLFESLWRQCQDHKHFLEDVGNS